MQTALPLAIFGLGTWEIVAIVVVGILLFGKRLPEIGKSFGKTIVEFKKGLTDAQKEIDQAATEDKAKPAITAKTAGTRGIKQIASATDEP